MKRLPKYHETFMPILQLLSSGETFHYKDLYRRVRDEHYSDLPEELLNQQTPVHGVNVLLYRIHWGKSYLKTGKFLEYPERGTVRITEKGRAVLKNGENLTLEYLYDDPDYRAYIEARHAGKQSRDSAASVEIENVSPQDASPQELIDLGVSTIESQVKGELLEKLKNMDDYDFEEVILKLLKKMGYGEYTTTKKSRDGGIDGVINEDKLGLEKIYIQAKRYHDNNKVGEGNIRNFIGALTGDKNKGVFVTTSGFSKDARQKAASARQSIILIDGNKLVDFMYQYSVGVQVNSTYDLKEIDEDFFDRF